jgi:pimeloyl-ACP methyl ester carboxylesterase
MSLSPEAALTNKSTNVRSQIDVPWALKAGLAGLARVAPGLAARATSQLFLTPPRLSAPERERVALRPARRLTLRGQRGQIQAWRLGPRDAPTVLLMHGWGGRGGQLAHVAATLADAGLSSVLFDAPGHGRSSGWSASVPEFAAALHEVVAQVGDVRALVAHSMGCAAAAFAISEGLKLDAAVFLAPPRNPASFFYRFCDALSLPDGVRRVARQHLERRFGRDLDSIDAANLSGARPPLLVVHDHDDADVPCADGLAYARLWPETELLLTSGLGHRRVLRDNTVGARIATFVTGRLAACQTCGRPASARDALARSCAPVTEWRARLCTACALSHELFERSTRWQAA